MNKHLDWRPGRDSNPSPARLCQPCVPLTSVNSGVPGQRGNGGRSQRGGSWQKSWRALVPSRPRSFYVGFVWGCVLATLWGLIDLVAGQTIYLDHSRGDLPRAEVEWAADVLSLKLGMDFTVSDTPISPADRCIDGGITMRRMSMLEHGGEFAAFAGAAGLAYDCPGGNAAAILFHPLVFIKLGLIAHELVHTAGCWRHLDDPEDTMYWLGHGKNGITNSDTLCALSTPFWPTPRVPDLCTTLILPDKSLYVPEIRERHARLRYAYNDALGRLLWNLAMNSPNPAPSGCPGYGIDGGVATIPAAYSPTWGWWHDVELLSLGRSSLWQFAGAR